MPVPGDKAKVLSSTGFHSKICWADRHCRWNYNVTQKQLCVLKFPSNGIEGITWSLSRRRVRVAVMNLDN